MDFDDGDLKDIWDTDLDVNLPDTLKLSNYPELQDWMDHGSKLPPVILNDKLMTDAIIGSCMPIKTEHSYSLNSDGDSLPDSIPDSPHSLQNKMDDMEEECYPAISMNGNSKHQQIIHRQGHVTTLLANNGQNRTPTTAADTKPPTFAGMSLLVNGAAAAAAAAAALATNNQQLVAGLTHHNLVSNNNNHLAVNHNLNLKDASMLGLKGLSAMHHHLGGGGGSSSSCHDSSSSSTSASEIDIDETMVKEEPLSPGSSCPSSPLGAGGDGGEGGGGGGGSLRNGYAMATASSYGHSDLVHEHHKNGALQLSPASQSLLKNQQIMVGSNGNNNSNLQGTQVMSKLNIKMEPQSSAGFGLPPTPPSSLPSDESEGNQSPEHHVSPMSPPTDIGTSGSSGTNSASSSRRTSLHGSSSSGTSPSLARVSSASHSAGSSGSGSSPSSSMAARESAGSSSSRQPIHTPLISSQPKGSTGTLILTEEEKRTLLAEGYPIPTRLPLTKAEEKSLKKIRRKIKNKISAQESRRKKKEYMDQLERRVEILVSENLDYRKRVESLEDSNQNLMAELAKLRQLIGRQAAAAGHRKS
ncbi:cyclic AMP response element-binding protein A-like isoform X2 [Anopheles albimanus]|uniref:cyclic AMP response element-binding protein A-like isoform X2 n=1 Tax=Anopheles albimanus TaxID=7167 RepID=UPI0016417007|nr:cyclic AMP response element-binding protein A-like isoform X2 [Anopheles albimanus]